MALQVKVVQNIGAISYACIDWVSKSGIYMGGKIAKTLYGWIYSASRVPSTAIHPAQCVPVLRYGSPNALTSPNTYTRELFARTMPHNIYIYIPNH